MAIKIKKKNRGLLHKNLGVPEGEKIPASKLKIKESDSPALKKRKQFAINAKKWKKGQQGLTIPKPEEFADVESYQEAMDAYITAVSTPELEPLHL